MDDLCWTKISDQIILDHLTINVIPQHIKTTIKIKLKTISSQNCLYTILIPALFWKCVYEKRFWFDLCELVRVKIFDLLIQILISLISDVIFKTGTHRETLNFLINFSLSCIIDSCIKPCWLIDIYLLTKFFLIQFYYLNIICFFLFSFC